MIRVRCEGKFPPDMDVARMKRVLSGIVHDYLSTNRCLPSSRFIQNQICDLLVVSASECSVTIHFFIWITVQEELRTVLNNSMLENGRKKQSLSKKEKLYFKNKKRKKCKGTCTICLKEGFRGIVLDCGHEFHRKCIQKQYSYNKSCPNCRKPIKV